MASNAHSTPVPRRRVLHLAYRKAYALPLSVGTTARRACRVSAIANPAITLAPLQGVASTDTLTAAIYAAGRHLPTDFAERLALMQHRQRVLDLAWALLDLADALDGDCDLEPDVAEDDGEEASAQPVTLAPPYMPVRVIHAPARRRAAA